MDKLALKLPGRNTIEPVAGMPSGGDETFTKIIRWGITSLFIILTLTALFYLIWGGIMWITSQGDKSKIEASRKKIVFAIIGMVVAFLSYLVLSFIGDFLGIEILQIPN